MPITNSTQPIHFRPMMLTRAQRAAFARAPRPQNASNILAAGNRTGDIIKLGDRTFTSTGGVGVDESKDPRTNGEATQVKKINFFLSFARSAWSAITCLPKFVVGPKGRILQSAVNKPDSIHELLESGDGRPNAKDMDTNTRLDILKALLNKGIVVQGKEFGSHYLSTAALQHIINDDDLMPRLCQIKTWHDQKHLNQDNTDIEPVFVFREDEKDEVELKADGTVILQGYHLSADRRSGRSEDLHDALRRAVGLPRGGTKPDRTPVERSPITGAASSESRYLQHGERVVTGDALMRRVRDSQRFAADQLIRKAFGEHYERIPKETRATMAEDHELEYKIERALAKTSGESFVVLAGKGEEPLKPQKVFIPLTRTWIDLGKNVFHLRSADEQNIHSELRKFFGLGPLRSR